MEYRFYSFVAHHYLSPLQQGLQTAHAVARLSQIVNIDSKEPYDVWAGRDQTIIICGASNHAGVIDAYRQLKIFTDTGRLTSMQPVIFFEDEQSMNKMATACGIIIPSRYYDALCIGSTNDQMQYAAPDGESPLTDFENAFVAYLKSFRLA